MIEQTSLEAYYKFKDIHFNKQEKAILELLKSFPNGLTINEMVYYTKIEKNAICGRLGDLRKKDMVMGDGTRVNEKSGVKNKVWKLK